MSVEDSFVRAEVRTHLSAEVGDLCWCGIVDGDTLDTSQSNVLG